MGLRWRKRPQALPAVFKCLLAPDNTVRSLPAALLQAKVCLHLSLKTCPHACIGQQAGSPPCWCPYHSAPLAQGLTACAAPLLQLGGVGIFVVSLFWASKILRMIQRTVLGGSKKRT